jgi:hypothetical protein
MNDITDIQNEDGGNPEQGSGDSGRNGQAPLLLHDMQFTEEAMSMPVSSGFSRSAMVAVLVVVAAVGSLFAMRQLGLGPALSLADVAVEYKPEESAKAGAASGKVLADLERSRRAVQVPAENITQDPFELNAEQNNVASPEIDADLARRAEMERRQAALEARQQDIEDALDELSLQSVMLGSRPVARINGQIYKVGMTVGEFFIITGIEGRDVKLFADDSTYTLSLDDTSSKRPGSKRNR